MYGGLPESSTKFLLLLSAVSFAAHGRFAQKLLTDLFSNYTNALRPVEDTDNILNVTLQITLSQIIDMVTRPCPQRPQNLSSGSFDLFLRILRQCHKNPYNLS